ncbi:MAG: hypothetical protein LPK88_00975 [Alphaproteobacteria bacterium]|nr:hypothetical protein [Alphaproteobacteria bacterium]MDX5414878.1 hypothetical protein [Alphaproteobacteria bacterium]MDX5492051.1 hypothetical protein [Alphaproteobacteria bacterium]
MAKRDFLAVYDYGMGGIWTLVRARSALEIAEKYPELKVFEDRPEWMSDEQYLEVYNLASRFDIEDAPPDWLTIAIKK